VRSILAAIAVACTLAACAAATEPAPATSVFDAPDIGPSLTLTGGNGMGNTPALASLVTGSPFAFALARSGTLPPLPACTPTGGRSACTTTFNGLAFTSSMGLVAAGGVNTESSVSGTIPASGREPARRIQRSAVSSSTVTGTPGSTASWVSHHTSNETGMTETVATPARVTADTGTSAVRIFFPSFAPDASVPAAARMVRMLGTSQRVIWTRSGTGPATYWRETTTFDSSTVVRTRVETPAGTRNCSIDLAANRVKTTCS